jgi:hypothetical protein
MSPPALSEAEEQLIVRDRLRWLAIGYYVKGAVSAIFVSFLLFHFIFTLGFSFIPETAWNSPPNEAIKRSARPLLLRPHSRYLGPAVMSMRVAGMEAPSTEGRD